MSLIPRDTFTPFPQHFWDTFFSHHHHLPFPSPFPFPFPSSRAVPFSDLTIETSGNVTARVECRDIPEAHLIAAELPAGMARDDVTVAAEDGGYVTITGGGGGGGGRFSWRMRVAEGEARLEMMSWSVENGVVTVVVPKVGPEWEWGGGNGGRDVRQIDITGSD